MFAKLLQAVLADAVTAAEVVDTAVKEFKADQNNVEKAKTVAKALVELAAIFDSVSVNLPK